MTRCVFVTGATGYIGRALIEMLIERGHAVRALARPGSAARVPAGARIRESGIPASILRPWYVLGPGHWWPIFLLPFYALGERLPATRESARRLGLVTLAQMVAAIVQCIERGPEGTGIQGTRILGVPEIRAALSSVST